MRRTRLLKFLVAILLVAGLLVPSTVIALTSPADNSNLLLGNPSKAVHSTASPNNYLMTTSNYTLSYNKSRGEPNWVSWYLGPVDLGSIDRSNDFRANTALPAAWEIGGTAYSYSGFDRGHNCPSGDRTSSAVANESTFLMSNMIPQAPRNNEGTWMYFENYLRGLVKSGDELYIVMGSYGNGGTGSKGSATTIDGGAVAVPSHIWKVAVVLSNVPAAIQKVIEARVDGK